MSDPRITDEAVEAAVRSLHPGLFEEDGLLHPMLANSGRWAARHKVRAALEAALPLLAPQPVVDRAAVHREAVRVLMVDALNAYVNLGPRGYYVYVDSVLALLNGGVS